MRFVNGDLRGNALYKFSNLFPISFEIVHEISRDTLLYNRKGERTSRIFRIEWKLSRESKKRAIRWAEHKRECPVINHVAG